MVDLSNNIEHHGLSPDTAAALGTTLRGTVCLDEDEGAGIRFKIYQLLKKHFRGIKRNPAFGKLLREVFAGALDGDQIACAIAMVEDIVAHHPTIKPWEAMFVVALGEFGGVQTPSTMFSKSFEAFEVIADALKTMCLTNKALSSSEKYQVEVSRIMELRNMAAIMLMTKDHFMEMESFKKEMCALDVRCAKTEDAIVNVSIVQERHADRLDRINSDKFDNLSREKEAMKKRRARLEEDLIDLEKREKEVDAELSRMINGEMGIVALVALD